MQRRERQLARLLRALIACCALLFAGAAPALPLGPAGDASAWVIERVSAPAALRARSSERLQRSRTTAPCAAISAAAVASAAFRAVASAAFATSPPREPAARPLPEQLRARRDGRHLYLEIQTLLC